ncbi:DUF3179 domain-containing protein [uncultured Polaribacter sp.]|uniref:DUF3179 domain-containing protein n=1 Tax=uncultured Polaribacter sp. TaxID=174711 RepID=UPI00260A3787|nr:DUF3179 domain-containing protein [uncultured Polaribacter sp.]
MKKLALLCILGILVSCQNNDNNIVENNFSSEWSIPIAEIFDGGPGRDGIPALTNPNLVNSNDPESSFIRDTDLVIGYKNGDDIRAYSHSILDWHEIINDNIGDVSVAITYCPLTGTGIGWNRILNGRETTFGVSGLLYNTNLIPFDRQTNSNWSQILNTAVNGELIDTKIDLIPLFETTWKTWKTIYPNTKVVSRSTGFARTYGVSPYGDYNTNNNLFLFPVDKDNRLPLKERIHTIIKGTKAKAYTFSTFATGNVIRDSFEGDEYLVAGNNEFIVSFLLDDTTNSLTFEYTYNNTESLLMDNEGNTWTIFGEAIAGPRTGQRLTSSESFMAFWFSIPPFYDTEIYNQ